MDGLECSEVLLSYTRKSNDIFRIDSSFFAKKYLVHEKQLSLFTHTTVAKTGADVKSFGAYSLNNDVEYVPEGIPFLRCLNIKNGFIDDKNMLFITPGAHKLLWKSEVMPGSFLLTMSGTIGNAAIAKSSLNYPINSNQDIAKIQFNGKYSNQVALAFFMSRYGSYQIEREARGSVQQHVFLSQVETLRLPCFCRDLVSAIDKCVNQAYSARIKSKQIYDDAMEMICDFFNVFGDSGKQSNQNETICIKTLKDSFAISGRLDPEYYQPKYDRLLDSLKKVPFRKLGGPNGIASIKKSIEPGSDLYNDNGIPFVRVSDISPYELEDPAIRIPVDVVENANDLFPKKDTILFSKDGSVGIAYKVEKDMNLITSSALLHLRVRNPNEVLPDYLTLVLNSPVVQMQAERDSNGAIIQHWKPSDIENVMIPVLDIAIQRKIAAKVQKSFALRHQSKTLLEYAKQTVETAIEHGEHTALEWLKGKLTQLEGC